uniref:Uncharacterized protein n=1 Tax=Trichogramma kaykai TaxID=54128 RepID=A0ABD2XDU4_9HYME
MGESSGIGHFQSGNVIIPGYIRFLSLFLSLCQIEKGTNEGGGGEARGRDCASCEWGSWRDRGRRRIAILNINYKNRVYKQMTIAESQQKQQQRDLKISTACVQAASSLTHAESACTRVQEVGNVEQSNDRALRNIMDPLAAAAAAAAAAATVTAAATAATAAALAAEETKKPAGGEKREEAILIPAWIRAGEVTFLITEIKLIAASRR